MNIKNVISVLLLFSSISVFVYAVGYVGTNYRFSSTSRLEELWTSDMANLKKANKLPSHWGDIHEIKKSAATGDTEAEMWIREVNVPIQVNPAGEYKLEILFLSQTDEPHKRAIVQLHMVHIPTGNSIWEFGRTYDLR